MNYGMAEAELGAKFAMRGARMRTPLAVRSSGAVARPRTAQDWLAIQGASTSAARRFGPRKTWRPGLGYYEPELGKFKLKKIVKSVSKAAKAVVKKPGTVLKKAANVAVATAGGLVTGGVVGAGAAGTQAAIKQSKTGKASALTLKKVAGKFGTGAVVGGVARVATMAGGKALQVAKSGGGKALLTKATGLVKSGGLVKKAAGALPGLISKFAGKAAAPEETTESGTSFVDTASSWVKKGTAIAKQARSYAERTGGLIPQGSDGAETPSYEGGYGVPSAPGAAPVLPEQEAGAAASGEAGKAPGWLLPAAGAALLLL